MKIDQIFSGTYGPVPEAVRPSETPPSIVIPLDGADGSINLIILDYWDGTDEELDRLTQREYET